MMRLLRAGLLAGAAVLFVTPVQAQSIFGDSFWSPPTRPTAASRAPARTQAAPQRRQQQSSWWFDDDEDEARPQARSNTRVPGSRPLAKGPAVMDGGGRPAISPAVPPIVSYTGGQPAGSVVIDTSGRALYYVLPGGRAYRYPIAVGRVGFTWTGTQRVSRIAAWPDWRPPAEMRARQPGLPELMTGGVRNPLGAKAIYLGSTLYRIHGTNDARSIGTASSSGCFRMTNSHVTHLAGLVGVGTQVQVMRGLPAAVRRSIASPAAAAGQGRS